jgi:hypothetical protein
LDTHLQEGEKYKEIKTEEEQVGKMEQMEGGGNGEKCHKDIKE